MVRAQRLAQRPAQRPVYRATGRGAGGGLTGYITINGELSGAVDEGATLTLVFVDTSMLGTITGGDNVSEGDSLVLEFEPVSIASQAWDRDGVAFDPAETGLTYTDADVQASDWNGRTAGITVTYSNGQTKRFTKPININFGPTITTQPTNQTVGVGQPATFTVEAEGFPTPTFQWQQFISG